ncbi:uncharacterized protein MONOS_3500 [Monocercomonoides exilis]|uniref:uncharacterized protein n=1 Tax=Monocercomonoides exilis TaxID=2049356 RepID=UPI003559C3E6|nr:hypothetical protein MONOS_3500 [Monocercomonoides exilis]|eukprot:MONOS_3500.1-p1 / transcript=MONOS_3500.1 / gene=MONOS_3500 / organism=Monocercomonoides_exilis_PA203 / gene_product=unspecified product / transcript_product=unspecified product / location=Mono_scaffold00083:12789-14863(+) / protein_length=595 / sequence_SO=supercontig / SO=protein_coding / is_pseudo=false
MNPDYIPNSGELCYLCHSKPAVIHIRERDNACRECFFNRIRHLFRTNTSLSRKFARTNRALVIFDNSISSRALVHLCVEAKSTLYQKRISFTPEILNITTLPFDHLNNPIDLRSSELFLEELNKNCEIPIHTITLQQFFSDSNSVDSDGSEIENDYENEFVSSIKSMVQRSSIYSLVVKTMIEEFAFKKQIPFVIHPQDENAHTFEMIQRVCLGQPIGALGSDADEEHQEMTKRVKRKDSKEKSSSTAISQSCSDSIPSSASTASSASSAVYSTSKTSSEEKKQSFPVKFLFPFERIQTHELCFYLHQRSFVPIEELSKKKKKMKKNEMANSKQKNDEAQLSQNSCEEKPHEESGCVQSEASEEFLFGTMDFAEDERKDAKSDVNCQKDSACEHSERDPFQEEDDKLLFAQHPNLLKYSQVFEEKSGSTAASSTSASVAASDSASASSSTVPSSSLSSTSSASTTTFAPSTQPPTKQELFSSSISDLFNDLRKEGFGQTSDILLSIEKKITVETQQTSEKNSRCSICGSPNQKITSTSWFFSPEEIQSKVPKEGLHDDKKGDLCFFCFRAVSHMPPWFEKIMKEKRIQLHKNEL